MRKTPRTGPHKKQGTQNTQETQNTQDTHKKSTVHLEDKVRLVKPARLEGTLDIPPSKSLSHRAIICASLAQGISSIGNVEASDDIMATIRGMETLGAKIDIDRSQGRRMRLTIRGLASGPAQADAALDPLEGQEREVEPEERKEDRKEERGKEKEKKEGGRPAQQTIDCMESGSTLRFLIPLALTSSKSTLFKGRGKLVERPLGVYTDLFDDHKISYDHPGGRLPLWVQGPLKAGHYKMRGDVSSQFISGLIFALVRLREDSRIQLTSPLESRGYVDLTLSMLEKFKVQVEEDQTGFIIKGGQTLRACQLQVEGDYSQSIFFMVGGLLSGRVRLRGLSPHSLQGDRVVLDLMEKMGAPLSFDEKGDILIQKAPVQAITVDCGEFPDLVPALAVLCALAQGTSHLINLGRLKIKECDRLQATYENLRALGADIERTEDKLIIRGKKELEGARVSGWKDHRMVMAMAMAALACPEGLEVSQTDSVKKSYPDFWQDYQDLGGISYER